MQKTLLAAILASGCAIGALHSAPAYKQPGASLNRAKQALLKRRTLEQCDSLDGVVDGLISATGACQTKFAINELRCIDGADTGDDCLSDRQIDALERAASPILFPYPLAHGVKANGPYPVYLGADLAGTLYDPAGPGGVTAAYALFANGVFPNFVAGKASFPAANYNMRDFQRRVQQLSSQYDASDPDIDAFRNRKGKLIIVQGTTDMLVPESMTTAYVDRLRARYGAKLRSFARYYVQPGYGHGFGDFTLTWDALAELDKWVETGKASASPVATDASPSTKGREMPLCEHPRYPQYVGKGDPRAAASYRCSLPSE